MLLCPLICVGEAPPLIDRVEGIAECSEDPNDLSLMNLGQATLITTIVITTIE